MSPAEAQALMLKHCISFVDLARASCMTVDALKKRIVASRQDLPSQLANIIWRLVYERKS